MESDTRLSRRTVLTSLLSSGLAALAGCAGGSGQSSHNSTSTSAEESTGEAFTDVSVEKTTLRAEFASSVSPDRVALIGPDGTQSKLQSVPVGATAVEFPLFPYDPGVNRLVAIRDGEQIGEERLDLQPDVQILDAREVDKRRGDSILVSVKNKGTHPQRLTGIEFEGVPNPTEDSRLGDPPKESLLIEAGQRREVLSFGRPLRISREGIECGTSGEMTIHLQVLAGSVVSNQFSIRTQRLAENKFNCQMRLVGE